jgi:hypothetical protein
LYRLLRLPAFIQLLFRLSDSFGRQANS